MTRTPQEIFSLADRVAIVTGASSGIGAHMTATLVAAGATVYAAARRVDRLEGLAAEYPNVVPVACDVTDEDQLRQLVAQTVADTSRIDILINNAGISDGPAKAIDQTAEEFTRVIDINLTSCFLLARLVASEMIERSIGGSIINIASVHGIVASAPNAQAGYVASKTGLIGLTRELAGQWARNGIRVNAIAPGYFPSELTEPMMDPESSGMGYIKKRTPMGRPGRLDELDGALLLLASDASTYLTGQTIAIDGGWTMI